MSLKTQVLFDQPQKEIASLIASRMSRCSAISIVVGFATDSGLNTIRSALLSNPKRLQTFVLGAATFGGYEALERLVSDGVPADRLFVHLGHTRDKGGSFVKFHPMMHSKVFLLDMPDGTSAAFIGSHNLTNFALGGKNGEAGVLLEGQADDPEFGKIRSHINEARRQSAQFDPNMKEALTWWTTQFIDGLKREVNASEESAEARNTFVLITCKGTSRKPAPGEIVYFEIPAGLPIRSLNSEVHIYVFDTLPLSPSEGLSRLHEAQYSLSCKTLGLEMRSGGLELQADWAITGRSSPVVQPTKRPFRPRPGRDLQQVRVEVRREVAGRFKYLFGTKEQWKPVYEQDEATMAGEPLELHRAVAQDEQSKWYLVRSLENVGPRGRRDYLAALKEVSPERGSYILLSQRRVDLDAQVTSGDGLSEAVEQGRALPGARVSEMIVHRDDPSVRRLLRLADERGYVTRGELNEALPTERWSSEEIKDLVRQLSAMGIHLIEADGEG